MPERIVVLEILIHTSHMFTPGVTAQGSGRASGRFKIPDVGRLLAGPSSLAPQYTAVMVLNSVRYLFPLH